MSNFSIKFKLIFLPFIYLAFATFITCTFLHWLLVIRFYIVKVPEEYYDFFVPAFFPFLPLIIWLRPKIKLLKLNVKGKNDPVAVLIILAGVTIAIPTIIAQTYVETATGKLTALDSISQVNVVPPTKYYTVKHIYASKKFAHIKGNLYITGKNKSDFSMVAYTAVPLFDHVFPDTNKIAAIRKWVNPKTLVIINSKLSTMRQLKELPADSIRMMRYINPSIVMPRYGEAGKYGALAVVTLSYKLRVAPTPTKIFPAAWLVIKYAKTISNSLPLDQKKAIVNLFGAKCDSDFKHEQLNKFIYLSRLPNNAGDLKYYTDAIRSRNDVDEREPVILLPVYEPFDKHNGDKLLYMLYSFAVGAVLFLIILQFIPLKNKAILFKV